MLTDKFHFRVLGFIVLDITSIMNTDIIEGFLLFILFPVDLTIALGVGGRIFDLVDSSPTLSVCFIRHAAKKN